MTPLDFKTSNYTWDAVSLGEVMLRFDPGEFRIRAARNFRVFEGGAEYNVTRGLRRAFGLKTSVVTAFADNELGRLLEDLILQGGVDTSHIKWVPYDGIGYGARNGLNFVERGFGIRSAQGTVDRAHTAISQIKPGEIDWAHIFKKEGARLFVTGGIQAGLSESSKEVTKEALEAAKNAGTLTAYDINFRPSLWARRGGEDAAKLVNRELVPYLDIVFGHPLHFTTILGVKVSLDLDKLPTHPDNFKRIVEVTLKEFPNLKVIASAMRREKTASLNDWKGMLYFDGEFHTSKEWTDLQVLDRIGGGDGFASGVLYGLLSGRSPEDAVNIGAAHGALAMTTPGDNSQVTLKEVEKVLLGGDLIVSR